MSEPARGGWVLRSVWSVTVLGAVLLLFTPAVARRFGPKSEAVLNAMQTNELNRQDATLLQRGYYENLIGVGRFNSRLWEVYMNRPQELPTIVETPAGRRIDNYLGVELVPSERAILRGAALTTNRWAMRDRDYQMEKPEGALRLAIVGPSVTMGWGVRDDETFENLVEDRINDDLGDFGDFSTIEILNFSVPGYVPVQDVALFERALEFESDVVMLFSSDNDVERTIGRLAYYAVNKIPFPEDSVMAMVAAAGSGTTVESEVERRLLPHGEEILLRYYRLMVELCRSQGALPVWVFMPALESDYPEEDKETMFRAARTAGFEIIDMADVYDGREIPDIVLGNGDFHPNARGHRIIAERFFNELRERPELLRPRGAVVRAR